MRLRLHIFFILTMLLISSFHINVSDASFSNKNGDYIFGYRVIFDRSYGQIYSIYDTGFCGYSDLAVIMEKKGFYVSETIQPLNETIKSMSCKDILFLGVAKNAVYSDEDVNSILSFIFNGGNAIIIGEHGNMHRMATFQNKLGTHLGVLFEYGDIFEKDENKGILGPEGLGIYNGEYIWFLGDGTGPLHGLKEVPIYDAAPLRLVSENATPILSASELSSPSNIVAAMVEYGKGKAIFIGDSEVFWNGDGNISINYKNGTKFAEEILDLLVGPTVTVNAEYDLITSNEISININITGQFESIELSATGATVQPESIFSPGDYTITGEIFQDGYIDIIKDNIIIKRIYLLKPNDSRFKTLIDGRGYARTIAETPDSLLNFAKTLRDSGSAVFSSRRTVKYDFDSYVVVNPLKNVKYKWLNKNSRVLIAGDMYTSLINEVPWTTLKENGYRDREIPAKKLSEKFGVFFSDYLVTSGDKYGNPFFVKVQHTFGFSFYTYNAVSLFSTDGRILAEGENGSWAERYNFFGYSIVEDASDSLQVDVMTYTDNAMVMGCGESMTDQFSGKEGWKTLVQSIADWLNFKYNKRNGGIEIITTERAKKAVYVLSNKEYIIDVTDGKFFVDVPENLTIDISVYYEYDGGYEGLYINSIPNIKHFSYPISMFVYLAAIIPITIIIYFYYIKRYRNK